VGLGKLWQVLASSLGQQPLTQGAWSLRCSCPCFGRELHCFSWCQGEACVRAWWTRGSAGDFSWTFPAGPGMPRRGVMEAASQQAVQHHRQTGSPQRPYNFRSPGPPPQCRPGQSLSLAELQVELQWKAMAGS